MPVPSHALFYLIYPTTLHEGTFAKAFVPKRKLGFRDIDQSHPHNIQIGFIPSLCYLLNSAPICFKRGAPQKQEELTKRQEDQGGVPMDSSPEPTSHSLYRLA